MRALLYALPVPGIIGIATNRVIIRAMEIVTTIVMIKAMDIVMIIIATMMIKAIPTAMGREGPDAGYMRRVTVNTEQVKGKWGQVKGEAKRRWGRLTDDDLTEAAGNYDKLVGKIQERYGESREAIKKWIDSLEV
ncbi:CsbD family protein [Acidiferrobacter thiooxydans]|jgi:uncharacterized protein YjbJ (UPF0337 family)|uniref:CsbD family protein n=1 Tax=Acidiferrobacter thiooxydans TaxID=163359 RepID=UPI003989A3CE